MNLLFDFNVNKETATIQITREFAAGLELVWDAFTKSEILDQWSAPAPWRTQTKEMDFREGGRWLYAMISPENMYFWSLVNFIEIEMKSRFTANNSFCDENGNSTNNGFTASFTTTTFTAGLETTTVKIVKKMASLQELEKFVAMGFKDGVNATLNNLDNLLKALSEKQ